MDVLKQILEQIKLVYGHMSKTQKASLLLVSVTMIICLFAVFFWSSRPDYVVLFSNLSLADAGAIQSKLVDLEVPHKAEGMTIKVPNKYVYETRLNLANEGLPKASGVGFELFDKLKIGQTDYMQRLNFRRALEGELSRTIDSLSPIDFSRVHLVIPEDTIFSDKEKETTASIVLHLQSGSQLDKGSVQSIKHLVAASVEGLDVSNITIIDSQGNLLSSAADGKELVAGMTATQLETQRNVERYMEQKAVSLLSGFLGPDKAIVRVSADMDFSQTEKTEETYSPEQQIARSENRIEETIQSEQGTPNTTEKTITNYEIGRTVQHMIGSSGTLSRVTVAVVLDGVYKTNEQGERTYVERAATEIESIKRLIVNALGLDEKRGDQIEVSNIAFDNSYLESKLEEKKSEERTNLIMGALGLWPWLLVLVLFFFFRKVIQDVVKQAANIKVNLPSAMLAGSGKIPGLTIEESSDGRQVDGSGLDIPPTTKLEKEVMQLAGQHPETVARIIRAWIDEK